MFGKRWHWLLLTGLVIPVWMIYLVLFNRDHFIPSQPRDALCGRVDDLFLALHISDIHLSWTAPQRKHDLVEVFERVQRNMPYLKVAVITGDLTDSLHSFGSSYQLVEDWKSYENAVSKWQGDLMDTCGNHDLFSTHDLENSDEFLYLRYSSSKSVESGVISFASPAGRPIEFVRIPAVSGKKRGAFRHMNFFGSVSDDDYAHLDHALSVRDQNHLYPPVRIAFSHFPMSSIHSSGSLSDLLASHNVSAFLCGHLHRLPTTRGYARHSQGLLELETSDFKNDHRVRFLAVFRGMLSIREKQSNSLFPVIIPLSPKEASLLSAFEPFAFSQSSNKIYCLVVPENSSAIRTVRAKFKGNSENEILLRPLNDELHLDDYVQVVSENPALVHMWTGVVELPFGLHEMTLFADDELGRRDRVEFAFYIPSQETQYGALVPPLYMIPRLLFVHVLHLDLIMKAFFFGSHSFVVLVLLFLKPFYRPIKHWNRRVYNFLIFTMVQSLAGPWFIGHLSGTTKAFAIATPLGMYWSDIGHVPISDPYVAMLFRTMLAYIPMVAIIFALSKNRRGVVLFMSSVLFSGWEVLRLIGNIMTVGVISCILSPALLLPSVFLLGIIPYEWYRTLVTSRPKWVFAPRRISGSSG
eukprot:ANDGO_07097.mRNA.1 Putative metallophosphoesterase At3g03305